jgi:hypothetical protein
VIKCSIFKIIITFWNFMMFVHHFVLLVKFKFV